MGKPTKESRPVDNASRLTAAAGQYATPSPFYIKMIVVGDSHSVVYAPPETTLSEINRKAFVKSPYGHLLPDTDHIRRINSSSDWVYFP